MAGDQTPDEARADRPPLKVVLCAPRGFCAGVDRAIEIVETALTQYGAPIYVRHEIVHNRFVVDSLERQGAIFIEELEEVEDDSRPVIFSAHGVPKQVTEDAKARNLFFLDATCPIVSKVHKEAETHFAQGRHILLIGHAGHPEVEGTMGQLPDGAVTLIETVRDVMRFEPQKGQVLAWIRQTTLSIAETQSIVETIQDRFPSVVGPHKDDICYATTNREQAVRLAAEACDAMVIVGAPTAQNSQKLRDVARRAGCTDTTLVQRAADIDLSKFDGVRTLGLSAGASAPEVLVEEVLAHFDTAFQVELDTVRAGEPAQKFPLPRSLRGPLREGTPRTLPRGNAAERVA